MVLWLKTLENVILMTYDIFNTLKNSLASVHDRDRDLSFTLLSVHDIKTSILTLWNCRLTLVTTI